MRFLLYHIDQPTAIVRKQSCINFQYFPANMEKKKNMINQNL